MFAGSLMHVCMNLGVCVCGHNPVAVILTNAVWCMIVFVHVCKSECPHTHVPVWGVWGCGVVCVCACVCVCVCCFCVVVCVWASLDVFRRRHGDGDTEAMPWRGVCEGVC